MLINGNVQDREYAKYLDRVDRRLQNALLDGPVFTTNLDLWDAYLDSFPDAATRQHHNCRCCRKFIQKYGGLVRITDSGKLVSAVWDVADAYDDYEATARQLASYVASFAEVTGVFYTADDVVGTPQTNEWCHLHATIPSKVKLKGYKTAYQVWAEKVQDMEILGRALGEYSADVVDQAVTLLEANALTRAEKVIGPAKFFLECQRIAKKYKGSARKNRIWREVATAGAGFCHIKSTMIGTLLDDLQSGLSFDDAKAKFEAKMAPLQYQRPQAAPKAGNIRQGEKLVQQLGLERSFERRFADVDEVTKIWSPTSSTSGATGVFAGIKPKATTKKSTVLAVTTSTKKITFDKFRREVLPSATEITLKVPRGKAPFTALTTAVHADAPLLFQWSNPFSWYLYVNGSEAKDWNLTPGSWVTVTAITENPVHWNEGYIIQNFPQAAVFLLEGARDVSRYTSLALFPETLRSDLHQIRSTMEAFSQNGALQNRATATACGISGSANAKQDWNLEIRATVNGQTLQYVIDRWD
jgi:hypothetical protein